MINTRHRPAGQAQGTPLERCLALPDLAATARLAAALARHVRPGDVIALEGALGAGKTAFARAFIQACGGEEEVPSPTFTLVQCYEVPGSMIWHFDLYRLAKPEDAVELGIEEAFADGVCLVEWPERLGTLLPADRLEVELAFGDVPEARVARLVGYGDWASRLAEVVL